MMVSNAANSLSVGASLANMTRSTPKSSIVSRINGRMLSGVQPRSTRPKPDSFTPTLSCPASGLHPGAPGLHAPRPAIDRHAGMVQDQPVCDERRLAAPRQASARDRFVNRRTDHGARGGRKPRAKASSSSKSSAVVGFVCVRMPIEDLSHALGPPDFARERGAELRGRAHSMPCRRQAPLEKVRRQPPSAALASRPMRVPARRPLRCGRGLRLTRRERQLGSRPARRSVRWTRPSPFTPLSPMVARATDKQGRPDPRGGRARRPKSDGAHSSVCGPSAGNIEGGGGGEGALLAGQPADQSGVFLYCTKRPMGILDIM